MDSVTNLALVGSLLVGWAGIAMSINTLINGSDLGAGMILLASALAFGVAAYIKVNKV
jgi:hypothetical protein